MTRSTAMRTAKIAAAVFGPLSLMLCYLTVVHEWWSSYWLALLIGSVLISCSPSLCADPIVEDETDRSLRNKFLDVMAVLSGLGVVWVSRSSYWMVPLILSLLAFCSPALRADPSAEGKEATREWRDKKSFYILLVLMVLSFGFIIPWQLNRPEVHAFLTSLKPQLKDWKPTTAVALLCLMMVRVGLRKALAFQAADLSPHLRRAVQARPR
ncbi:hypothetical protein [Prosthecobacter sp.]|uniref:hypothetical protein n=1 Tax=Prosthecobacter sp. TaxID=1965333 RepID=UPI0037831B3C